MIDGHEMEGGYSLLVYQGIALGLWLIPFQFWALASIGMIGSFKVFGWFGSWSMFFALFRAAMGLALVQFMLILVRHQTVMVRKDVHAVMVFVAKVLVMLVPVHAIHGLAGILIGKLYYYLMEYGGIDSAQLKTCSSFLNYVSLGAGVAFSLGFYLHRRNVLGFASLQRRRHVRARKVIPVVFCRSFVTAVIAWFAVDRMWWRRRGVEDGEALFGILFAWTVTASMDLAAELYEIFATENRSIGMCTQYPVSREDEAKILTRIVHGSDKGSLQEALLNFPFTVVNNLQEFELLKKTDRLRGSSSLLLYAKVKEIETMEKRSGTLKKTFTGDTQRALKSLRDWWIQTCESVVVHSMTTETWEEVVTLRKRRFDAVLQSIYTADAFEPGFAFWNRQGMGATKELVRARAFQDLATLAETDESRRRVFYNDKKLWMDLFESCTANIDALTITLMVATKNCALEPTIPVTENGHSLMDVFVLKQSSNDAGVGKDYKLNRELAWKAEQAARELRRQPWVSVDWWKSVIRSQAYEHDPVSTQIRLEREKTNLSSRRNPGTDASKERKWEEQWTRQQRSRATKWLRNVAFLFKRSPTQESHALFADSQVAMWSATALGSLVAHANDEDQFGHVNVTIVATLNCLMECLIAIEEYVKSPAFLGSVDPLPELNGQMLTRPQVLACRFVLERAIYNITTTFHERLGSYQFPPQVEKKLQSMINFE